MILLRQREFSKKITKLVNSAIREKHGYVRPGHAERLSLRRVLAKDKGTGKEFEKLIDEGKRSASGTSVEALMERINLKENNLISKGDIKTLKKRGSSKEFLRTLQRNHDHNLGGTWTDKNSFERKLIMKRRNNK